MTSFIDALIGYPTGKREAIRVPLRGRTESSFRPSVGPFREQWVYEVRWSMTIAASVLYKVHATKLVREHLCCDVYGDLLPLLSDVRAAIVEEDGRKALDVINRIERKMRGGE